jgi:hypothetical protein
VELAVEDMKKLKVQEEGRKGIYLADKNSLKEFIEARKLEKIHNFCGGCMMIIRADDSVAGCARRY